MNYKEIKKDLFQMDTSYALAHCVSQDCAMGAGIAKEFRRRYPSMPRKMAVTNPQIGDAKSYQGEHLIFNLFTKARYWNKPTYKTLEMSIQSLKEEMLERNIKRLAIPQLGAGLDKLNWNENRKIIQEIFMNTDVEIVVCLWK
jgi:O-acetyl-ADP-ribose deacetylase (regulator of RNase III)